MYSINGGCFYYYGYCSLIHSCIRLHIYSSILRNTVLYTFQIPGMWALKSNKSLSSGYLAMIKDRTTLRENRKSTYTQIS